MIWLLNITHFRHPKRVYLTVSVITDRYLSDKIANTCEYYFNSAYHNFAVLGIPQNYNTQIHYFAGKTADPQKKPAANIFRVTVL